MSNLTQMAQGLRVALMTGITGTTTSVPQRAKGHNAIRLHFNSTAGSGTWSIKVQGKGPDGNFSDAYDQNGTQMAMNSITADKCQAFVCLPEHFRIVATEDGDGATVNVGYELFSV